VVDPADRHVGTGVATSTSTPVWVEHMGNGLAPGLVDRIEIPARTG
jgi:hypothetical protein